MPKGSTVPNTGYPRYQSYLIRIWRESAKMPWRGSLQSVADGSILRFDSVESMLNFLLHQTDPDREQGQADLDDESSQ